MLHLVDVGVGETIKGKKEASICFLLIPTKKNLSRTGNEKSGGISQLNRASNPNNGGGGKREGSIRHFEKEDFRREL